MNGIKVFLRIIFRNKILSAINLAGLAVGIASCLFITLYVANELNYDGDQPDRDRIYRLTTSIITDGKRTDETVLTSAPLAVLLKQDFPEIEESTRCTETRNANVRYRGQFFKEKDVYAADSSYFRTFRHTARAGDLKTALSNPGSVVITEAIAAKYFGSGDPIGQVLEVNRKNRTVTAVLAQPRAASDLKFDMMLSLDEKQPTDWMDFSYYTYVLVHKASASRYTFHTEFEQKLKPVEEEKYNKTFRKEADVRITLHLQLLDGLHFQKSLLYDTPKGNKLYVYLLSITALFILVVACLNFINFSIVQSIRRSTEVGIRKIAGADFVQLVRRYLGESLIVTSLAVLGAYGMLVVLLPTLNKVAGSTFRMADLFSFRSLGFALVILFVTGILAGGYPAFYTASIMPLKALRGKATSPGGDVVRRISVAMQFVISIGLIICTLITFRQMNFIRNYDLGFSRNNTIVIHAPSDSVNFARTNQYKSLLLADPRVKAVAVGGPGSMPGGDTDKGSIEMRTGGRKEVRMINYMFADADYLPMFDIPLVTGRNFNAARITDGSGAAIVNEAMVRAMGWKEPLLEKIGSGEHSRNIIGVVSDFHYQSLYNTIEPQVILPLDHMGVYVFATMAGTTALPDQLRILEEKWRQVYSDEPFVHTFVDDSINEQYAGEDRIMKLFTALSILTIVISCLGLFGLSTLTIHQRRREIGIRRVIGADFKSLLVLFSKEYLGLILVAFAVVAPVTWILMSRWLETFPFREPITVSLYVIMAVAITCISVAVIFFSMIGVSASRPASLIAEA